MIGDPTGRWAARRNLGQTSLTNRSVYAMTSGCSGQSHVIGSAPPH